MSRRNAQGLSVSTLILVALGILVLIMAIVFYSSTVDNSRTTLENCQNLGGECRAQCPSGTLQNDLASCPQEQRCCVGGQNT